MVAIKINKIMSEEKMNLKNVIFAREKIIQQLNKARKLVQGEVVRFVYEKSMIDDLWLKK